MDFSRIYAAENDFRRENDHSFVEKSRRGRRRPDEKRRAEGKMGRGGVGQTAAKEVEGGKLPRDI